MNTKQALEIIKAALDQATQRGVFQNIDSSAAVIQAYNVLFEKLNKTDDTSNN